MTDWLMVIITAIYVVATIIICVSNYKSAKLANMSNDINLICKIVEIEQSRLLEIKKAIDNFVTNASLSYQITDCKEPNVRINAITDSFQLFQLMMIQTKWNMQELHIVQFVSMKVQ